MSRLIQKMERKVDRKTGRYFRRLIFIVATCLVCFIYLLIAGKYMPVIGAEGADGLRGIIGDEAVAKLEISYYQLNDSVQRLKYSLGFFTPADVQLSLPTATPSLTLMPVTDSVQMPSATSTYGMVSSNTPTHQTMSVTWYPLPIKPLSQALGEGIWAPYLQESDGTIVGFKTFVQPDPGRPYTLVAVIAINLASVDVHYVLGRDEPASQDLSARTGMIPVTDLDPKVLLAAFNGGFKSRHGQFGAMAGGQVAIPARTGLGTLALFSNGDVRLGEWGTAITASPDMVSYRQNGPMVIRSGKINPVIYNYSPQDWGYTVNDVSPTVRSGIGLSLDNKTLFYFCGPSLSMEALAKSMLSAGASNAIQLDINDYWVLFVKVNQSGTRLVTEPLLPQFMVSGIDRYLHHSSRDFFYITSSSNKK
jgi:hypothetical protein